jgi:serine/threonine protein kinase
MNAESEKIRQTLGDQLASLDDSLGASPDDVEMLANIQKGIGRLLAEDGSVEGEIRRTLQDRFDNGELRKETFQLVKSMLDRFVTENTPTSTSENDDAPRAFAETRKAELGVVEEKEADEFSSTAVIPNESLRPPTADDQVQVGSVLRDRFLLQERVSGGSMGVVYKALDRRLAEAGAKEPWVAIKVLSPQLSKSGPALRALQQEATKGRCLTHPGIVRFIDLDRDDDLYFIVMEWLDGRTLADILDSEDGKHIGPERALAIVKQIAKALDYAHKCGIVHADVKPGNVMVLANGDTRLFDFGVARILQAQTANDSFDPGVLNAVTPEYSSMQVLTGEEPVPADDVFSLACLWYRLIAGYRVFGPRNAAEAASEGMKPQRLKTLSDSHWRALKKAISYSRVTRFESMTNFLNAIANSPTEAISVDPDERVAEVAEGGRSWFFGLLVLLGLLTFAGYQFGLEDVVRSFLDRKSPPVEIAEPVAAEAEEDLVIEAAEVSLPQSESEQTQIESARPEEEPELVPEPTAVIADQLAPPVPDYSALVPADFEIELAAYGGPGPQLTVTLRENGAAAIIDLIRDDNLHLPLALRFEEVGYSGNRSPWASGQIEISDNGLVSMLAGQNRARVTLNMSADPLREADQQSTMLIREADSANAELATIELILEDDDQRTFESQLPANTIAFAVSQVAVGERDPAVQIDILRFNPDSQALRIEYLVKDITATEGQDYFSAGSSAISFEPGQRTARLLIPLVQDSLAEGDEAFTVELLNNDPSDAEDVFQRIVIMIRDDDPPSR